MHGCDECKTLTRRRFLKTAGIGLTTTAFSDPLLRMLTAAYAQSAGGSGNLLVLCQLNGGLDALSFLAPFSSSVYRSRRPQLALGADAVTPLPDRPELGITNLMPMFSELYAEGQLAIVQQVAYPESNGSHFESQDIFEYGVRNLGSPEGTRATWYERLRSLYFDGPFRVLDARTVGDPKNYGYPDSTYRRAAQDNFGRLARMEKARTAYQQRVAEAYARIDSMAADFRARTADFEPSGELRGQFYRAAAIAYAGLGTKIIRLSIGGFDTHASQLSANERLFPSLDSELQQFINDLKIMGLWEKTCICFYTEFGRRNAENGSPGTDHGHGGHMMLAGPGVRGGLYGQNVTSADMNAESLPYYVDFRGVFSSCIRDWLGFDPRPVFQIDGETYDENVGGTLFA